MPRHPVFSLILASAMFLFAGRSPAQLRPVWTVDPLGGLVLGYEPGGPPDPPMIVHAVGGTPLQVRADLSGRAVAMDMWSSMVHLVDESGFVSIPAGGYLRDAIPDGEGGALLLLLADLGSEIAAMDAAGRLHSRLSVPGAGSVLRSLGDGTVLLTGRQSTPVAELRRYRLADGALLASRVLPASPRDIPFDDDGNVLVAGLPPEKGVVTADRNLVTIGFVYEPDPILDFAPYPGGRVAVITGSPPVLKTAGNWPFTQQLAVLGSTSLQSWPDRTLCGGEAWTGQALHYGLGGVFEWIGSLPTGFGSDDGAGLDYARSAGRTGDPDRDGSDTGLELRCGTDPGDAGSAPFRVWVEPSRLLIEAPWHPGATYVVQASASALEGAMLPFPLTDPLALLSWIPGAIFDHPVGSINGSGLHAAIIVPVAPPGATWVFGGALLDPLTLRVISSVPARPFLP